MTHRLPSQLHDATILDYVRREAEALGFSAVGCSPATPLEEVGPFDQWLASGMQGKMSYMANHRALRTHAAALHPGAQTVLSFTAPYRPLQLEDGQARIAAYAHGEDYHGVIRERLQTLLSRLETFLGFSVHGRAIVDSAPFLERAAAERAGLGWFGRSSMLIHPQRGTYTLLSQLLIDLPLQEDVTPVRDHCGNCRRCVDACPTGAIVADRVVDGRRCISYLTIELKTSIPRELRAGIGDQLFGCDICQAVCPWNRFADDVKIPELSPRSTLSTFDARQALTLDRADFRALFKGTPLERSKRRGLARNAAVVLGNQRRPEDLSILIDMLKVHDEALVREHIVWALAQYFHDGNAPTRKRIQSALLLAFEQEVDHDVRKEIIWARETFHF